MRQRQVWPEGSSRRIGFGPTMRSGRVGLMRLADQWHNGAYLVVKKGMVALHESRCLMSESAASHYSKMVAASIELGS